MGVSKLGRNAVLYSKKEAAPRNPAMARKDRGLTPLRTLGAHPPSCNIQSGASNSLMGQPTTASMARLVGGGKRSHHTQSERKDDVAISVIRIQAKKMYRMESVVDARLHNTFMKGKKQKNYNASLSLSLPPLTVHVELPILAWHRNRASRKTQGSRTWEEGNRNGVGLVVVSATVVVLCVRV